MFGKPKRQIQRDAELLKKRLADLENEEERLRGEISALENGKIQGYYPPISEDDFGVRAGLLSRKADRLLPPTRRQSRRKRNHAIILIILALLLLIWIIAKIWRGALE